MDVSTSVSLVGTLRVRGRPSMRKGRGQCGSPGPLRLQPQGDLTLSLSRSPSVSLGLTKGPVT